MKPTSQIGGVFAGRHSAEADSPEIVTTRVSPPLRSPAVRFRLALGIGGLLAAAAVFAWLALGWVGAVPSMVEVFGMSGLRIPAGVAVGGLLLAAIGFNDF